HSIRFGNDYLSATCSLDRFDLGNSGICDAATKVENKVLSFLNKKLGMGICTIGSGKASSCGNKYVRNACDKVIAKAKNYPINGKDSKIGEAANSPLGSILRVVDKYLDVTVTRSTCDFDISSSTSGGSNGGSASGGSNGQKITGRTNIFGENTSAEMDNFSDIYSMFIERQGANSETAQYITRCMKMAPSSAYKDSNGETNPDNVLALYEACKPENAKRGTASEIETERQELSKFLSGKTEMPNWESSLEMSSAIAKELDACNNLQSLEEAEKCQQNLQKNQGSVFAEIKSYKDQYFRNIEENTAMVMAASELLNIDHLRDTSQASLEQTLAPQRGKFMNQALKADMEVSLMYVFYNRLADARKELAKLSFQKMQDCATPFYVGAVSSEIQKIVSDAKDAADKTIENILNK
ncbi:MAG: hypothetical protein J6W17_05685, partial [Campylobacter sp.]|nr:hypothetical protein [Campylobacter sp.]